MQNSKVGSLGRFDMQALAVSGQIPPQPSAALHAGLLNRPAGNLFSPAMDQPALLQGSVPVSKCITIDQNVAYGQPLRKCPSNISKHFSQTVASAENAHAGIGSWSSKNLVNVFNCSDVTGIGAQNGNITMGIVQHQQRRRHQQEQHHKQSMVPVPGRTINVFVVGIMFLSIVGFVTLLLCCGL